MIIIEFTFVRFERGRTQKDKWGCWLSRCHHCVVSFNAVIESSSSRYDVWLRVCGWLGLCSFFCAYKVFQNIECGEHFCSQRPTWIHCPSVGNSCSSMQISSVLFGPKGRSRVVYRGFLGGTFKNTQPH